MVKVTSAMPVGLRFAVPLKITSAIFPPRNDLADCSPSTQLMASLRFDLPHPFGPTTAAMPPPLNRNSVLSQKDLKPWISTRFSFSKLLTSSARGTVNYSKRDYSKSKAILALYTEVDPVWPPDIVVLLWHRLIACETWGPGRYVNPPCLRTRSSTILIRAFNRSSVSRIRASCAAAVWRWVSAKLALGFGEPVHVIGHD